MGRQTYSRSRYYSKSTSTMRNEDIDRRIRESRKLANFVRIALALFEGEELSPEDTELVMHEIRLRELNSQHYAQTVDNTAPENPEDEEPSDEE